MNEKTEARASVRDPSEATYWTWVGVLLVNCFEDGTIPLNAKVVVEVTKETTCIGTPIGDLIARAPRMERVLRMIDNRLFAIEHGTASNPQAEAGEMLSEIRKLLS